MKTSLGRGYTLLLEVSGEDEVGVLCLKHRHGPRRLLAHVVYERPISRLSEVGQGQV